VIKIEEDAKKANALNWDIKLFIVMTSLSRDTYIQKSIINSQKNIPFKIRILFWEDIEEAILSNNELCCLENIILITIILMKAFL